MGTCFTGCVPRRVLSGAGGGSYRGDADGNGAGAAADGPPAPLLSASSRTRPRVAQKKHTRSLVAVHRDVLDVLNRCRDPWALEEALEILKTAAEDASPIDESPQIVKRTNTVIMALSKVKQSSGRIGLDIGGTLAKMVVMQGEGEEMLLAERFGKTGRRHADLAFLLPGASAPVTFTLHFVSGDTDRLRRAIEQGCEALDAGATRKITVAGGGAHRFADAFRAVLNIEFQPFQEMESLVTGLQFLHEHAPVGEVFTYDEDEVETPAAWPELFYPCLLVNIGSGVSILRIDAPDEADGKSRFTRLGGTACGGATFLGLMQLIAGDQDFDGAKELVERGDVKKVNTLVQDIYGVRGCANLGLPPCMNAAYFGKLIGAKGRVWDLASKEDLSAALMTMVVQESVVLARAFSQLVEAQCGHAPPVFFVGGFLAGNAWAQRVISATFLRFHLSALFLRHADFLGALGALSVSLGSDLLR